MKIFKLYLVVIFIFSYKQSFSQKQYDSINIDTVQFYKEFFIQKIYYSEDEIIKKELYDEKDSILRIRSFYKNGKLEGLKNEWWDTGELKVSIRYEKGLPIKEWKEWYKDGTLSYEEIFDSVYNIGISYYENGAVKSKEFIDKSSKLVGKCMYFCQNGQIIKEIDFDERRWENLITYHCNGQIASKGTTIDHFFRTGDWMIWYENGNLKETGSYKNRTPGSVLPETKIGEWKYYYSNGYLAREEYFSDDGKKIGVWKYYDEDSGIILKETEYGNDALPPPDERSIP